MNKLPFFLSLLVLTSLSFADQAPPPTPTGLPGGRTVTLSDFGAEDLGYLALPATPPSVGVVLVPDCFGLDAYTKQEASWLASQGFIVVAVDIYNGHQVTDQAEAANLGNNLSPDLAIKTINAGISLFHESPRYKVDHVAVLGWGVGAKYAYEVAKSNRELDASVLFYGPTESSLDKISKFQAPICAFYPQNDPVATHDIVGAFQQAMRAQGNTFDAWFIAAGRGWSHPNNPTYNPTEDQEAWKVAIPYLQHLSTLPVKPKDQSLLDKFKKIF